MERRVVSQPGCRDHDSSGRSHGPLESASPAFPPPGRCRGANVVISALFWMVDLVSAGAVMLPAAISGVSTSPAFFNPSIGQRETITFVVARPGTVRVEILDRDRYLIRRLAEQAVQPGPASFSWDGKDAAGLVVPDEAYTLRIALLGERPDDAYDPSRQYDCIPQDLTSCTYSRGEGILSYTLPWPARVHILAGQATPDPATKAPRGPVLRTVVDRQPRSAGLVVETWNGFDESGTIYVPDLPHFVVGITITPLPENAIIAVGNRDFAYFDYAVRRRPQDALRPRRLDAAHHSRHVGLTALEDQNPPLRIGVKAAFDPTTRTYRTQGKPLDVTLTIEPRRGVYFLNPNAELTVFVDERLVLTRKEQRSPVQVTLGANELPPGLHRVTINWVSGFGPVAVTAVRVNVVQDGSTGELGKR